MTDIRPATPDMAQALCALRVSDAQDQLIAPNHVTLEQAKTEGGSTVFGLFADSASTTPIGLLAVVDTSHPDAKTYDGEPENALYVWRLMVDLPHQHGGHGRAALAHANQIAQTKGRTTVFLSVSPGAGTAMPFYERLGFAKTGRIVDGEVEMSKPVTQTDT